MYILDYSIILHDRSHPLSLKLKNKRANKNSTIERDRGSDLSSPY